MQLFILDRIGGEAEVDTSTLKTDLEGIGVNKSQNGLSDTIIRLERQGLIAARHTGIRREGTLIRQKFVRLTATGEAELAKAEKFFERFRWTSASAPGREDRAP